MEYGRKGKLKLCLKTYNNKIGRYSAIVKNGNIINHNEEQTLSKYVFLSKIAQLTCLHMHRADITDAKNIISQLIEHTNN